MNTILVMAILGLLITLAIALTILLLMPVNLGFKDGAKYNITMQAENPEYYNVNFSSNNKIQYYPFILNYAWAPNNTFMSVNELSGDYTVLNKIRIYPNPIILNSTKGIIQVNIVIYGQNATLSFPSDEWYFSIVYIKESMNGNYIMFSIGIQIHHVKNYSTLIIPIGYNNETMNLEILIY
ncbi:hypothetical protein DFR86_05255 [Acidianus sulfidivorans JP7]|uniref:Uncharacterized protein n=1 Tax=Acidianus sulfidivorans JP7 TaxID=619593 RepID=A0A2U9ILY4_9CREN|nr:hypothetical protein [Acidianus sulfidivorans]AWR97027.1 hypothetical protein DFR86_05255 [Acidianus sulfidivorans JP7]